MLDKSPAYRYISGLFLVFDEQQQKRIGNHNLSNVSSAERETEAGAKDLLLRLNSSPNSILLNP